MYVILSRLPWLPWHGPRSLRPTLPGCGVRCPAAPPPSSRTGPSAAQAQTHLPQIIEVFRFTVHFCRKLLSNYCSPCAALVPTLRFTYREVPVQLPGEHPAVALDDVAVADLRLHRLPVPSRRNSDEFRDKTAGTSRRQIEF